jgi:hypothetical protein
MVVACVALAIALSGAGYAAVTLPRNSVGTKTLKNNAVTSAKIKNKTIGTADLADAALVPRLFARVDGNGAPFGDANESFGVTAGMIQHDLLPTATTTGPGVYCIRLPFQPRSVMVVPDSASAATNVIASVALRRGNPPIAVSGCDATHQHVRVTLTQVTDTAAPVRVDHGFFIWILK